MTRSNCLRTLKLLFLGCVYMWRFPNIDGALACISCVTIWSWILGLPTNCVTDIKRCLAKKTKGTVTVSSAANLRQALRAKDSIVRTLLNWSAFLRPRATRAPERKQDVVHTVRRCLDPRKVPLTDTICKLGAFFPSDRVTLFSVLGVMLAGYASGTHSRESSVGICTWSVQPFHFC